MSDGFACEPGSTAEVSWWMSRPSRQLEQMCDQLADVVELAKDFGAPVSVLAWLQSLHTLLGDVIESRSGSH
jgi:hypothetical protein